MPHPPTMTLQERYDRLYTTLRDHDQGHLLRFYDELDEEEQAQLLTQLEHVDHQLIKRLRQQHHEATPNTTSINPPSLLIKEATSANTIKRGEQAIKAGKVAIFIVAGGQGSRLGYDGPKGLYPLSPIKHKTLFNILCEKIKAVNEHYGTTLDIYIMTSDDNHEQTVNYFKQQKHFGLDKNSIIFFKQQMLPAIDQDGKILLASKHELALAPGGTGGIYAALCEAGITKRMREKGIEMLSYVQIDNPLVLVADPAFVGAHLDANAEMSLKVVEKSYPEERVGIIIEQAGKAKMIEYIHLPEKLAYKRDEDGTLTYKAANIAVHLLNREFVDRIHKEVTFNYVMAHKRVPYIDGRGDHVTPIEPNAHKFEAFVFDALPHAKKTLTMLVKREDEFAPVKNAEGHDSPDSARNLMVAQAKQWLEAAGIPEDTIARLDAVEISPSIALTKEEFVEKVKPVATQIAQQLKGQQKAYLG